MTRVSNTPATHKRRKKIISQARGYKGSKGKLFKAAKEQLMRSWAFAYRDRRIRLRERRKLWVLRLNNALKEHNISYSRFIHSLKLSHININRYQLSEMSINNPTFFTTLVDKTKSKDTDEK